MIDSPLFGILILDREPLAFAHFWGLFQAWLQIVGGCAAVGLAAYLLYAMLGSSDSESNKIRMPVNYWMLGAFALSVILYAVYFALVVTNKGVDPVAFERSHRDPNAFHKYEPPPFSTSLQPMVSAAAGLVAIVGIGQLFLRDLFKLRLRRIWALSKLGFKEAVRNKVFWAFLVILIPFLFPITWFQHVKPEDELRATISVTWLFMTLLLIAASLLLASFSIPNDIKNQNIYTVVSKPVERFEVVLGRFVGYTALLTVAMAAMTTASLLLIRTSTIDEKAKEESFTARVPFRGKLRYESRKGVDQGVNVGREFDYRKYIGGHPLTSQRAIWSFGSVPSSLTSGEKDAVWCEYTFDIFRLTKGEENRGVDVNFRLTTWKCDQVPPTVAGDGEWKWKDPALYQAYVKEACEKLGLDKAAGTAQQFKEGQWDALNTAVQARLTGAKPGTEKWAIVNDLAQKYGFYEVLGKEVYDYHPGSIPVPVGLFKNARDGTPKAEKDAPPPPAVQAFIKCMSGGQMLGMAEGDLHLLEAVQPFEANYFKTAIGLWCVVALVIAVAVTLSTYLAGVISLLCTLVMLICSLLVEHIRDVANHTNTGGGPFESFTRLIRADTPTAPLDATAGVKTARGLDSPAAWVFQQVINLLPELDDFLWTNYLMEGFNVSFESLAMNLIVLFGYVLPWGVLAYYLLRNREVAA
jgi:hypothetical protein